MKTTIEVNFMEKGKVEYADVFEGEILTNGSVKILGLAHDSVIVPLKQLQKSRVAQYATKIIDDISCSDYGTGHCLNYHCLTAIS